MSADSLIHGTHRASRLKMSRVGLALFLASESFLFLVLIAARFLFVGTQTPAAVNQTLGWVLTAILLASSVVAHRAHRSVARGRSRAFQTSVLTVIGLSVVFLAIVGYEWSLAATEFPASTLYGSFFFIITGMHAFHLLVGALMFGSLYVKGRKGQFTPDDHWGAEATIWYWHYVDVVWLTVFTTLYLVG